MLPWLHCSSSAWWCATPQILCLFYAESRRRGALVASLIIQRRATLIRCPAQGMATTAGAIICVCVSGINAFCLWQIPAPIQEPIQNETLRCVGVRCGCAARHAVGVGSPPRQHGAAGPEVRLLVKKNLVKGVKQLSESGASKKSSVAGPYGQDLDGRAGETTSMGG